MRIVGHKSTGLNQPPATPEEAWRRGRVLDAMLPNLVPVPRGVSRMTHDQRNVQDDARMLATARKLNTPSQCGSSGNCVMATGTGPDEP